MTRHYQKPTVTDDESELKQGQSHVLEHPMIPRQEESHVQHSSDAVKVSRTEEKTVRDTHLKIPKSRSNNQTPPIPYRSPTNY